jgi:hypothetical protein
MHIKLRDFFSFLTFCMPKTHGITAIFSKIVFVIDNPYGLLYIKVRENLRIMEFFPLMKVKFVKSAP